MCVRLDILNKNDKWLHISQFISLQQLIKSFEVCEMPVRAGKFVVRKNWVVSGSVSHNFCIYRIIIYLRLQLRVVLWASNLYCVGLA